MNFSGICGTSQLARVTSITTRFLDQFYDDYPRVEAAFQVALDASLDPRGPELLFDMVDQLGLPRGGTALDVGCGEGRYSIELAKRFGMRVHGIDPVPRHIEIANQELAAAAEQDPQMAKRVRFDLGTAEELREADQSIDLIWCRDVLVHVAALDQAFAECHRVLRNDGHMLLYQPFGTDRLEPREAEWLWTTMGVIADNTDPKRTEAAFSAVGFDLVERIELHSEWGERGEEESGRGTVQLLHAARLLRATDRFVAEFGQTNYDIKLGDCLWHIYQMIGKLGPIVYLLRRPAGLV